MSGLEHLAACSAEEAARADFYALIARLFYAPPDAELLRQLAQADELVAEDASTALPLAWNRLLAAAAAMTAEAAREEYDALFIGVGRPEVMLFGSYYLTGFMMEKPLAQLRDDLAALGLARKTGVGEPEDHIAALADVMRFLVRRDTHDGSEVTALQQRFYLRHIKPWYARLCETVEAAPRANFYAVVARFTKAFLDLEADAFGFDM